jgi:uncharacterized delta-60 repeat protein
LLQSTGKIIVVTALNNLPAATQSFGVVRFLSNGVLDTSFGTKGVSTAEFTNFINSPNAAALQSDGKIVVAGEAQSADGTVSEFAVARFNPDGGLDTHFGNSGKVTTAFIPPQPGGISNSATVVMIQSDGRILVAGGASRCAKCIHQTAWARYDADGNLDASFGEGGKHLTNAFGGAPNALAELANGDLLSVAGSVIAQYAPNGALRPAVTDGAIVASSVGGANVFQSDGKFLLAQSATGENGFRNNQVRVFRFGVGVDWAFNNDAFSFGPDDRMLNSAAAVIAQPDGKIILGGSANLDAGSENFGLARINADGSLDSGFGSGGKVTTAFTGEQAAIRTMVLQPDGKILVVGGALNSSGGADMVLARYLGQ